MSERTKIILLIAVFLGAYFIPEGSQRIVNASGEALFMLHEYAREHVLLCLIPAFFIAGAIAEFISQDSVMKYLGSHAKKLVAYAVASVSGTVLAVCSCTVLPLFAGIYSRGAGVGPATAFLYSGPAINVLAIILTARVLGLEMGIARAVGAIVFSIVIGLGMHFIFRKSEQERQETFAAMQSGADDDGRPLRQTVTFIGSMVLFLIFANFADPQSPASFWGAVYRYKWLLSGLALALTAFAVWRWLDREEIEEWLGSTRDYALLVMPLLFAGVLVAGFLLGRPGQQALIPESFIAGLVGGNSLGANVAASLAGALMYFATLTEVPILQGLLGSGMGKGPALALLLAGPAVSLPNMLVIRSVIGTKKTLTYIGLVVSLSTVAGLAYGALA